MFSGNKPIFCLFVYNTAIKAYDILQWFCRFLEYFVGWKLILCYVYIKKVLKDVCSWFQTKKKSKKKTKKNTHLELNKQSISQINGLILLCRKLNNDTVFTTYLLHTGPLSILLCIRTCNRFHHLHIDLGSGNVEQCIQSYLKVNEELIFKTRPQVHNLMCLKLF